MTAFGRHMETIYTHAAASISDLDPGQLVSVPQGQSVPDQSSVVSTLPCTSPIVEPSECEGRSKI